MSIALVSWSGGKDSCLSLYRARKEGMNIKLLITSMDETGQRSRSHGVSPTVLTAQALSLKADICFYHTTWETYESKFIETLKDAATKYDIETAIYGDIDIQSHRDWEDKVSTAAGLKSYLPLWQQNRLDLVHEFISLGFKAIVVCVNGSFLTESFCGREFDQSFVDDLPEGVDACGENGEFHTFVYDGPSFEYPVNICRVEVKTYIAPPEHGGKTFYFQVLDMAE